jgi:hypothetical protein
MAGVTLPGEDELRPGPHRDLVVALHGLYQGAGRPALRRIAEAIGKNEGYLDTVSHERVGAMLRGTGVPGWPKVECVVRQLASWHRPSMDADEQVNRFIVLWRAASGVLVSAVPESPRPGLVTGAGLAASAAGRADGKAMGWEGPPVIARGPSLPVVRGRDEMVRELADLLDPRRCPGRPRVLAGPGGTGKSTVAWSVVLRARSEDPDRRVWWLCAADEERLSGGLASLARDLGVVTADQERMHTRTVADLGDVADRVWELLESQPPGWLLVIDNVDEPAILGPLDGTGWIRSTTRGLVLITSRDLDAAGWVDADLTLVTPLSPEAAAQVLVDLAPTAGDQQAARELAERLGCLPLALRIAGMQLRQHFESGRTFDEYLRALVGAGAARVTSPPAAADRRTAAGGASELSLDALARAGFPQARPLLWLLSCYAPGSLIPEEMIAGDAASVWSRRHLARHGHPMAAVLDPAQAMRAADLAEYCRAGLLELQSVGLIQRTRFDDGQKVIEVHPSIAEDTRAVMEADPIAPGGPDPSLVRASAVATICETALALDTGRADHWRCFRVLTPHLDDLLAHAASDLCRSERRDLLNCMVRCIASHAWSKAEQRAEQLAGRALRLADELGCCDMAVYLRLQHVQALARRERGWLADAEKTFRRVLAAQLQLTNGATRLDTLRTRQQLAWTVGRQGRWSEAEQGLLQVIQILGDRRQRRSATGDPAHILLLHARCMTYWCIGRQGRWRESEEGYRQLLTDRVEVLGPDHPDALDVRYNIGKALAWQGKWTAAEAEWHHTAADRAQALGRLHPDTLLARQLELYAGGYRAWQSGDRSGRRIAVTGLEMVLSVQQDKRGEDHRETLDTRALLTALRGYYSPEMIWPEDLPRPGTE